MITALTFQMQAVYNAQPLNWLRSIVKLSNELKQHSLQNLNILSLLFHKHIIKCLYKCGRREITIFLLPLRHHVTGKMTTKTFLYLFNGQKRAEQYYVFNISQDVFKERAPTVFHCFCRFTFISISCDIDNFVLFFRVALP